MAKAELKPIDERKQTNTEKIAGTPFDFVKSLSNKLMTLGIMILIGGVMLYSCRVAQTNIIPTSFDCFPYTDEMPIISEVIVNIDIVKTEAGVTSTKLKFPIEKNLKMLDKGLLGFLRYLKQTEKSNTIFLYISTMVQSLISVNLSILNTVYSVINSAVLESIIIFVLPYVAMFVVMFLIMLNGFYTIYLWYANLYLFFSTKEFKEDKTVWTEHSMWETWRSSFISCFIIFWSFILLLMTGTLFIPGLAVFCAIYSLILPIFMEAETVVPGEVKPGKPYTFKNVLLNILKYKLSIIMLIISYYVISDAFSILGGFQGALAIIVCLILYFFTNMYKPYVPKPADMSSPDFSDSTQADKQCKSIKIEIATPVDTKPLPEPSAPPLKEVIKPSAPPLSAITAKKMVGAGLKRGKNN